jgi:glucose-1-phosphate thymidylyltransferase
MIFYPLQTLAEMGCREVLVVVGGRSVGDILELLHDGSDLGLSLTYRYQRGALGIAHAIGLAKDFAGGDPIAIVLGDNILNGSLRDFADAFAAGDAEAGAVL